LIKKNEQKKELKKRRFTIPFTWLGLVWGIMSVIFAFTLVGKEEPTVWYMYVVFLPVYLDFQLIKLINFISNGNLFSLINHDLSGVFSIFGVIVPIIPIGVMLGFITGLTTDRLIIFFKYKGNDDG